MEDFNKEDKSKQEEFKEQEPQNDFGDTIKRVAMTAIGGVADAAEAIAKGVQSAANKENIDRLAQKGENAVKQVKDFSESAAKQVLDFGSDTVNKIKKAWDESKAVDAAQESVKSLEDDIMASLKKAEDLIDKYLGKDRDEEKDGIIQELLKQKEEISNIKNKMSVIMDEEAERIKREKQELGIDEEGEELNDNQEDDKQD